MQELDSKLPEERPKGIWPNNWGVIPTLALLLVLTVGVRFWVLWTTEVPARDSIGFIRYALRLEEEGWHKVVSTYHQHPGYPLTILACSYPVRYIYGKVDCNNLQFSAQLASSLAGVLLIFPMFFLGKYLYSRSVGFWASLLFQCLPASGHVLSDAISDPLFLFLATSSLLFGIQAVQENSVWRYGLCGILSGLTYLVRPEGALIAFCTGIVLLAVPFVPFWRRSWKKSLVGGVVLTVGALVAGSPYYLTTGCFTKKPSASIISGQKELSQTAPDRTPTTASKPRIGPLFAAHIPKDSQESLHIYLALEALVIEFAHAYQYIGWLPALLGLWFCRERYYYFSGIWVGVLLFVFHGFLLWLLALKLGYVSDRHILILIILSIYQATTVMLEIPQGIRSRFVKKANSANTASIATPSNFWARPGFWSVVILLTMTGLGLSKTIRPLHGNRAGHHAAGIWLKKNSHPVDKIIDDHCWAHFYAERVVHETKTIAVPSGYTPRTFVVYSRPSNRKEPSHERGYNETDLRAKGGTVVYYWPTQGIEEDARVLVFELPR